MTANKYWLAQNDTDGDLGILEQVSHQEYKDNVLYDVSDLFPVTVKVLWSNPVFGYEAGEYVGFWKEYLNVWEPISEEDIAFYLLKHMG